MKPTGFGDPEVDWKPYIAQRGESALGQTSVDEASQWGGESKDAARHCGLGGGTLAKNWQKDVHPVPMAILHLPVCSYLMLFDAIW